MRHLLFTSLLLVSAAMPNMVQAGSLKETWYLYRGQENMKIKNYKAAIEAYEKAVEINPENQEASRELGLSYERQGLVDKAVGENDRYLNKWPSDRDVSLRQARLLRWSRYSYRQQDAAKHYRAALAQKSDPQVRLEYADLLASKKETSGEAIKEYELVLKSQPRNGAAHRGLSKVYAWNDNKDQALYHSKLAREYGDTSGDAKSLQYSLEKDRRPYVGAELRLLNQTSSKEYELSAVMLGAFGNFNPTPFVSAQVRAGSEMVWNKSNRASGMYVGAGFEYRFSPEKKLGVEILYQGVGSDRIEYNGHYDLLKDGDQWTFGLKRSVIYDSYTSALGLAFNGVNLGAARKNLLYADWKTRTASWDLQLAPYTGWVSAQSVSPNWLTGLDLRALLLREGVANWTMVAETHLMSFQRDQSGFNSLATEPLGGGYFSPSLFAEQDVLARYQSSTDQERQWFVELGPAYQYVKDSKESGSKWGGRLKAESVMPLSAEFSLQMQGEVVQVSDIFTQMSVFAWLRYKL